ncbi:ATP-binding protein [Caldimonas thermodepolymerans]|uniref:ATP-binding protein n=1 Tax=Caldimonas thermodepolymerans TaxID=215580 RepID=A0A2S5T3B6_9BURK|nr:ATP-binding protein [Caldimonas thermodepolymerans]PPE69485.1 ATP-binding protein [Caldimonas thermodepolymerans]QPC31004.1 ATP-binding protein [Caldimonas thermodepolymerans]RDH96988.1 putative DNA-binding protein [Caldimonas thermodepolymerans]
MDDSLLDALRYKSEGPDVDFKEAQYRFENGNDATKSEMLKDILAMANSWREGAGYIVLGFRDRRPHPAEVVGITEHIDDAKIQQFVNSKVKPKLEFRYEEHVYDGKTVGVISIPKQKRPFSISNDFGKLRRNIVYVRRGSSTDEAEPIEIAAMAAADAGRGPVDVALDLITRDGEPFPGSFSLDFFEFTEQMPDYRSSRANAIINPLRQGTTLDNEDFWRQLAEFARCYGALIEMRFALRNHSGQQLTNTKLEVTVEGVDGLACDMLTGDDLPEPPTEIRRLGLSADIRTIPDLLLADKPGVATIKEEEGNAPSCHVRFGVLLPGEVLRSSNTMALVISGPGQVRLKCRILAAELSVPVTFVHEIEVAGTVRRLDFEGFKAYLAAKGLPV